MGHPHEHLPAQRSGTERDAIGGSRSDLSHEHLWIADDGTGLHAPPGRLVRDPATGELCCHVCGEFFRSLGAHVRAHGYTADEYRRVMGLARTRALTSSAVSDAISLRQRRRFATSSEHRSALAVGHEMARDGRLSTMARTDSGLRPEAASSQARARDRGRATQAHRRDAEMRDCRERVDGGDFPRWLGEAYANGASLEELGRSLGIGRRRVRDELERAGVGIRRAGVNGSRAKRSRIVANDDDAARRVGTDDLVGWLEDMRRQGHRMTDLAAAVGRSESWVRTRLLTRSAA